MQCFLGKGWRCVWIPIVMSRLYLGTALRMSRQKNNNCYVPGMAWPALPFFCCLSPDGVEALSFSFSLSRSLFLLALFSCLDFLKINKEFMYLICMHEWCVIALGSTVTKTRSNCLQQQNKIKLCLLARIIPNKHSTYILCHCVYLFQLTGGP